MQRQNPSLEETLIVANRAREYARSVVLKGSTQIENNALPGLYMMALGIGMKSSTEGEWKGVRESVKELIDKKAKSDPLIHPKLIKFESYIEVTTKYSLGNCQELSLHALNFILINNIDMNAEVFNIRGKSPNEISTHVVLVLNRLKDSNPKDPTTWGEDAVVCDPWLDKVYKASNYLQDLKLHYFDNVLKKNCLENFDPLQHNIILSHQLNSEVLKKAKNMNYVLDVFAHLGSNLVHAAKTFNDEINLEFERLKIKSTFFDERILILADKINVVEKAAAEIKLLFDNAILLMVTDEYKDNYSATKSYLNKILNKMNQIFNENMRFSNEDLKILSSHKEDNIMSITMKFFGVKSETRKNLEKLERNVNEWLEAKKPGK